MLVRARNGSSKLEPAQRDAVSARHSWDGIAQKNRLFHRLGRPYNPPTRTRSEKPRSAPRQLILVDWSLSDEKHDACCFVRTLPGFCHASNLSRSGNHKRIGPREHSCFHSLCSRWGRGVGSFKRRSACVGEVHSQQERRRSRCCPFPTTRYQSAD
jgi:hypothetical protein